MKRVIALGFFDGVHIGHGALLKRTSEIAEELGAYPAVMTFDVPPMKSVELITSPAERAALIREQYGIEDIILLHFDEKMRRMLWNDFILMLRDRYDAVCLVAGYDFRFGYMGDGDSEKLKSECAALGLGSEIVGKVELCGEAVTSTRIRELIAQGDLEKAAKFLGHPFFVSGQVAHGRRIGHALGAPTVNLTPPEGKLLPARGVYATRTVIDIGETFCGITNVGVRPTVSDSGRVSIETHLFDFDADLYGREIKVEFLKFLRGELKFPNTNELQAQIELDRIAAQKYFE